MSNTKPRHTPGPYFLKHKSPGLIDILKDNKPYLQVIARVPGPSEPQDLPNAQLLAAAPDLLEHIQDATDAINEFLNSDNNDLTNACELFEEMLGEFKTVIACAKGEQTNNKDLTYSDELFNEGKGKK